MNANIEDGPNDPPFDTDNTLWVSEHNGHARVYCYLSDVAMDAIVDLGAKDLTTSVGDVTWGFSLEELVSQFLRACTTTDQPIVQDGVGEKAALTAIADDFVRLADHIRAHVNGLPVPHVKGSV